MSRLDETLARLCLDFQRRSAQKHTNGGYAVIVHHPAYQRAIPPRQWAERWTITYYHADGTVNHWGSTVGYSRSAVVAYLRRQKKEWP